jgi:hypothetical protein
LSLLLLNYLNWAGTRRDLMDANLIFIGCLLLHLEFATVSGTYSRYDAYLVLLGIFVISVAAGALLPSRLPRKINRESLPSYLIAISLVLFLSTPLIRRATQSLKNIPHATNNVYEQQYQMGIFICKYYQGRTIALNDIGVIDYLADIHLVDLWGLGSLEPARLRHQNNYTTQNIKDLTHRQDVSFAIVYEVWFERQSIEDLHQAWENVGQWTINNNVALGGNAISFYAINPSARQELIQNLRQFELELPQDVIQNGTYLEKQP